MDGFQGGIWELNHLPHMELHFRGKHYWQGTKDKEQLNRKKHRLSFFHHFILSYFAAWSEGLISNWIDIFLWSSMQTNFNNFHWQLCIQIVVFTHETWSARLWYLSITQLYVLWVCSSINMSTRQMLLSFNNSDDGIYLSTVNICHMLYTRCPNIPTEQKPKWIRKFCANSTHLYIHQ